MLWLGLLGGAIVSYAWSPVVPIAVLALPSAWVCLSLWGSWANKARLQGLQRTPDLSEDANDHLWRFYNYYKTPSVNKAAGKTASFIGISMFGVAISSMLKSQYEYLTLAGVLFMTFSYAYKYLFPVSSFNESQMKLHDEVVHYLVYKLNYFEVPGLNQDQA